MNRNHRRRGFTLIELILVMSMLTVVLALAAPKLSWFFRGRMLEEEARRLLALTRFARSQSVSLSVPMELWLDTKRGCYGLAPAAGFEFDDIVPLEFVLPDELSFNMENIILDKYGLAYIQFYPDGTIGDDSIACLYIRDDENEWIGIEQADYGLGFVIFDREEDRVWQGNVR